MNRLSKKPTMAERSGDPELPNKRVLNSLSFGGGAVPTSFISNRYLYIPETDGPILQDHQSGKAAIP
jgi:hypothetical protein